MRFHWFVITFLTLYSWMHLYFFLRARAAFPMGTWGLTLTILFLLTMVLAPLLVRISERSGFNATAEFLAYAGYTWMGFLFLFVCASLAVDICRILTFLAASALKANLGAMKLSFRAAFLIPFLLAASVAAYGYMEALTIRDHRITIKSPKIPKEVERIRVVQISDVHLGLLVREARLKRILDKVNLARPDILVSTGDLVDGQPDNLKEAFRMLREVQAPHGKFAVTGNHEVYAGLSHSLSLMEAGGFTVLRGAGVTLSNGITVAGIDDPVAGVKPISEADLLSTFPRKNFTILLKHRPDVNRAAAGRFDLQLSGHVHGGQIFPFGWITELAYPYGTGFFALPGGTHLAVSRGSGTWGPPIRFLAPPEVLVIDLIHGAD